MFGAVGLDLHLQVGVKVVHDVDEEVEALLDEVGLLLLLFELGVREYE